ncbi:MAG: OmpA family protein [Flammeovirgaceae bacterium]|nr:OmpA family protein [Flammeovirgaceae bacterium]
MYSIRCVLIFLTVCLLSLQALAQDGKQDALNYLEQAKLMQEASQALNDIREIYVLAATSDPENIIANFEAGHLYLKTINKERAVDYFLKVRELDANYRFDLDFWIAKSYQYGLQWDKAIEYYTLYKEKLASKPNYQGRDKTPLASVDKSLYECENGKAFVSHPQQYAIVNIGREVNSEYPDYAPILNGSENEIIFTSRRRDGNMNENVADDNEPWEDIFTARKEGGNWSYAKNIGSSVNTPYHDSNLALSADGSTLFMYKDDGGGDIYYSERQGNDWSEPQPLPGIINSSYNEKSVSISTDENALYFSSNRPGGFGGYDIYVATKNDNGEWTYVKNLGPKINSDDQEDGPFISYDGSTLYFSCNGRNTMGGFDIFKSNFDKGANDWTEPENVGYPINTPDDDIYIVFSKDGQRGYYSSVREDGLGYTDIYMITIPDEPVVTTKQPEPIKEPDPPKDTTTTPVVKTPVEEKKPDPVKPVIKPLHFMVNVVDAEGKAPLDARVKLQGLRDNRVVGSSQSGTGVFDFSVTSESAKEYRLSVEVNGYVFQNLTVRIPGATTEDKSITRTVEMRKLAVGVTSILRNLYFDFDKATFKTESYTELNKLENMLATNPGMKVEIGGHTDNVGTWVYNKQLSQRRAEAVKDFLVKKGIDPRRVKAVGYGEMKPLASNDDNDDGREINRRVEVKVIQK